MKWTIGLAALALAFGGNLGGAHASCDIDKAGYDLTGDEAEAVHACLSADLHAGYNNGNKRWIPANHVSNYVNWQKASAFPAAPGFHNDRFLVTYVNEVGFDEYTQFKEENVNVPAGTVIAKESFSVSDSGKVKPGPLFIMEKAAPGSDQRTDDWYYMMVSPSGAPQAINVYAACSSCHLENFGHQGALGYPIEEARIQR